MKCLLCGAETPFGNNRVKKFCNRQHYLEYCEAERNRPKSYCLNCGNPIMTLTKHGEIRKYCSDECQKEKKHKDRFKYVVCQICGRHIDFDCDSNSDYYPSIDHIIPISKGGEHQWDNVQLACRVCNTLKGTKLD